MMLLRILPGTALLVSLVLVLGSLSAPAGDEKDNKDRSAPSGIWVLKGGEAKIEFADKNVMKVFPHGENKAIIVVCQCTEKDKRLHAKITELDGEKKAQAQAIIPVGLEFSFTWQAQGDSATLRDMKGTNIEQLRSHLEGQYERKR
jgi:hypothetical protein